MKPKSATEAILRAIVSGQRLTTLNGFRDFVTSKLPTRCAELELKYGFRLNRKGIDFTSKYGIKGTCYEYSMKVADRKKVASMLKKELHSKK